MTSNEVEAAVLSSMYINSDVVDDVRDILGPSGGVFGNVLLGEIYERMLAVYAQHGRYDATLLLDGLGQRHTVELTKLADYCQTSANAEKYAEAVLTHFVRREAQSGCREIATLAKSNSDQNAIMESIGQLENRLANVVVGDQTSAIADSVDGVLQQLQAQLDSDGQPTGISSGIPKLDALTGGWGEGELVIVAARPSVGKSAFALHVAATAAQSGTPVYFASLEMSAQSLCSRLVLQLAGTPMERFQTGFLGKQAMQQATEAAQRLADLPIYVDDSSRASIWDIRGRARRCQRKYGKGLIVVDYLQLVRGHGKPEARHLEIAEISAGLKQLARDQACPVIALCQVNRQGDSDGLGPHTLKYLRESGSIEQDADKVLFLARASDKELEKIQDQAGHEIDKERVLLSYLAKNRNGATGPVVLDYDRSTQRIGQFGEVADSTPEPQPVIASSDIEHNYDDDDIPF